MIGKKNINYVDTKSNYVNPNGKNSTIINLKLLCFLLKLSLRWNSKVFVVWSFLTCLQNLIFCIFHLMYHDGID